jgi:hypothetical protein
MSEAAVASTVAGLKKFVIRTPNITADANQAHGAQMVVKKTVHEMQLRFKYTSDRSNDKVNIILLHKTTMKVLWKVDPTIENIPNDRSIAAYSDVKYFPNDKASFSCQFSETIELVNGIQRITLCHAITASSTLYDLKFNSEHLLPYLRTNNITIVGDKFAQATIASIGFFINVHPHWIHRETFASDIYSIIEDKLDLSDSHFRQFIGLPNTNEDNDISDNLEDDMEEFVQIPNFEFATTSVRFGSGSEQVATEALDVVGSKKQSAFLKEIFCSLDFT